MATNWILLSILLGTLEKVQTDRVLYWTVNLTEDQSSRIYYNKGEPEVYLNRRDTAVNLTNKYVSFDVSQVTFGAIAVDSYLPQTVLAHDRKSGIVYYVNVTARTASAVFKGPSEQVKDLAVDWLSKNLYYTDPLAGVVLYSYKNSRYSILDQNTRDAHGIDVDPLDGYLFVVEEEAGRIRRSSLAGNSRSVIVSGLQHPTLLVADVQTKSLFWIDVQAEVLQTSDYSGQNRAILWNSYTIDLEAFGGFDIYEDYLILASKKRTSVSSRNKTTGESIATFGLTYNFASQFGLAMAAPERQPWAQIPCSSPNNGGCAHICTSGGTLRTQECLCHLGYSLSPDGDSCQWAPLLDNFMLVVDTEAKQIYQVDLDTEVVHTLSISGGPTRKPEGVTFDRTNKQVFWTDISLKQIRRLDLNTREEDVFFNLDRSSATQAITFADAGRHIYYSDANNKRIGRITLEGMVHMTVIRLSSSERPLGIQLDESRRQMYWTDWGRVPKIEKANMDNGGQRQLLASGNIRVPTGLALDLAAGHLYWVDNGLLRLERVNLDGTGRQIIMNTLSGTFSVTLDNSFLYLSHTNGIMKVQKSNGAVSQFGPNIFLNIFGTHLNPSEALTTTPENPTSAPTSAQDVTSQPSDSLATNALTKETYPSTTTEDPQPTRMGVPDPDDIDTPGLDKTVIITISVVIGGVVIVTVVIAIGTVFVMRFRQEQRSKRKKLEMQMYQSDMEQRIRNMPSLSTDNRGHSPDSNTVNTVPEPSAHRAPQSLPPKGYGSVGYLAPADINTGYLTPQEVDKHDDMTYVQPINERNPQIRAETQSGTYNIIYRNDKNDQSEQEEYQQIDDVLLGENHAKQFPVRNSKYNDMELPDIPHE